MENSTTHKESLTSNDTIITSHKREESVSQSIVLQEIEALEFFKLIESQWQKSLANSHSSPVPGTSMSQESRQLRWRGTESMNKQIIHELKEFKQKIRSINVQMEDYHSKQSSKAELEQIISRLETTIEHFKIKRSEGCSCKLL